MLEIRCKSNLAATAEHVQGVLLADADLTWLVESNTPGDLYDGIPGLELFEAKSWWLRVAIKLVPSTATVVNICVLRKSFPILGNVRLSAVPDGCLVSADNIGRGQYGDGAGGVIWTMTDDVDAILPVWERIVAELRRLGLVVEVQAKDNKSTKQNRQKRQREMPFSAFEVKLNAACATIWNGGRGRNPTKTGVCDTDPTLRESTIDEYLGDEDLTWTDWLTAWVKRQAR